MHFHKHFSQCLWDRLIVTFQKYKFWIHKLFLRTMKIISLVVYYSPMETQLKNWMPNEYCTQVNPQISYFDQSIIVLLYNTSNGKCFQCWKALAVMVKNYLYRLFFLTCSKTCKINSCKLVNVTYIKNG